jgi:hypothetical protein
MPMASVRMAVAAKAGDRWSDRHTRRRSSSIVCCERTT